MARRVFVTGIGIISAIGKNIGETLESIRSKKTGIAPMAYLQSILGETIPVAEVKCSNSELHTLAGVGGNKPYTRTALLGLIAAKQAVVSAGISDVNEMPTGLISSTTVGGMDKSEHFYVPFMQDNRKGRLREIITHECAESTERIADHLGVSEYVTTISTACSSAANAAIFGARLIKHGILERVIIGGTDALTRFTINGFNTLMILDKKPCKPFDEHRGGLTIGEGAGFLVLESENAVRKSNKPILCELAGYGNANDAFHQTASSPDGTGAFLAMNKALATAGIKPEDISYINCHGTGTQNNDLSEGIAMERIFTTRMPYFSSTKGFTGHALAAAGALEAVLSVLAIKQKWAYPSLHFSTQMKELKHSPVTGLIENFEINHLLSNSFGFGGNNSTLIFSRV